MEVDFIYRVLAKDQKLQKVGRWKGEGGGGNERVGESNLQMLCGRCAYICHMDQTSTDKFLVKNTKSRILSQPLKKYHGQFS